MGIKFLTEPEIADQPITKGRVNFVDEEQDADLVSTKQSTKVVYLEDKDTTLAFPVETSMRDVEFAVRDGVYYEKRAADKEFVLTSQTFYQMETPERKGLPLTKEQEESARFSKVKEEAERAGWDMITGEPPAVSRISAFLGGFAPPEKQTREDLQKLYPVETLAGKIGQLAILALLTGGIAPAATAFLETTPVTLYPKLIPFIANALQRSATWGIGGIIDVIASEPSAESITHPLSESAFGVLTGGIHGLETTKARVLAGGLARGGWSAGKALLKDGSIDKQDLTNIGVSVALGAAFELINAPVVSRKYTEARLSLVARTKDKLLRGKDPTAEGAVLQAMLKEFEGIMKQPAIVMMTNKIPVNINKAPVEFQKKYVDVIIDSVKKGMSVEKAIEEGSNFLINVLPSDMGVVFSDDIIKEGKETIPEEELQIKPKEETPEEKEPEVTTDLEQEALKYDSAEEFVSFMRGSATQYKPYNPKLRATVGLGEDSARISDLGIDPEMEVTIYRGVSDGNKKLKNAKIVDGDFVVTDRQSAESYSGKENVIEKRVKAKDLIADYASEFDNKNPFGLGAEFVYSDSKNKLVNYTEKQLTDIWNKAQGKKEVKLITSESIIPKTGEPFKFSFIRNLEKSPDFGKRYGQDVEPAGRFMTVGKEENVKDLPNFESGIIQINNPLIVDFGGGYGEASNWKNVVSKQFGGKTGIELTRAIIDSGYDGIITISETRSGDRYTSEIVDLKIEDSEKVKQEGKKPLDVEEELPKEVKRDQLKVELDNLSVASNQFLRRIRRTEAFDKEIFDKIPKKYMTRNKNAITLDEALEEVNNAGLGLQFETIEQFAEFLGDTVIRQTELKAQIEELKPKLITKKETTIAKDKLKNIEQGVRKGTISTKQQIKATQTELINILESSDIEPQDRARFIRTIKNIQTPAQLEKALPDIGERIAKTEIKIEKNALVKEIKTLAKTTDVDGDYVEQIDALLEDVDLQRRTEKTKARRENRAEFLARQQEEGDLMVLPADFFSGLPKKTLDELTIPELQDIKNKIDVLVTVGKTKNRLLTVKRERSTARFVEDQVSRGYKTVGREENADGVTNDPLVRKRETAIEQAKNKVDGFFAAHRKVEFVLNFLGMQDTFEVLQSGINKKLADQEVAYTKITELFTKLQSLKNVMTKDVPIEGVRIPLTREQMIGVALNAGNKGNFDRLIEGHKFTSEEVRRIQGALIPEEKIFVKDMLSFIDGFFEETVATTKDLTGLKPEKVEGKYFPIITDTTLDNQAKFREAQKDLFQDIFQTTFVERGFTKSRRGGRAPMELNVFDVILRHVDGVIHYNSLAKPVRDLQKIISHSRVKKLITDVYGRNVYNQFPAWLRDVANPKTGNVNDILDPVASMLRKNATMSILGWRVSVSLLQGSSFTQTINELGLTDSLSGLFRYISNPKESLEFVFSRSPEMRNRSKTFDREIKDFVNSRQAAELVQGKKSYAEILFVGIRAVDFVTTMPSWLAAYDQQYKITGDNEASVTFADGVVRRTQPSGATQNLAAVMRGSEFKKVWTSFMTHFANVHNNLVRAIDKVKFGTDHPMRKATDFSKSMMWLWLVPAVLGAFTRSGGKPTKKKIAQEIATYPFAGILFVRDIMNSVVKGFDFGAPPAFTGFKEAGYAVKSKSAQKKLKHGIKAVGTLSGRIPTQTADTLDGFIDIMNNKTKDFRRLIWSEKALEGEKPKERIKIGG